MNTIKALLIEIKNTSNLNKYDMNHILKKLQTIYVEKLFSNFFAKKETTNILNQEKIMFDKYKKNNKIRHILSNFIHKFQAQNNFFIKTILTIFIINTTIKIFFSENPVFDFINIIDSFFLSFFLSCFFSLFIIFLDLCLGLKKCFLEAEFSETYDRYIKDNYKEMYTKASLEIINEIDSIDNLELKEFKKELKEHIIKYTYNINQNEKYIFSTDDLYIIDQIGNNIFKDKNKPLNNKILTKEDNEDINLLKQENNENILDVNDMLKKIKIKFEDKVI